MVQVHAKTMGAVQLLCQTLKARKPESFHAATGPAHEVPVALVDPAQREAHLIFARGHEIHQSDLVQILQRSVNRRHVQTRHRFLHRLTHVPSCQVAVMVLRFQFFHCLQDRESLRRRPQLLFSQQLRPSPHALQF
jgi:hypothetical protein